MNRLILVLFFILLVYSLDKLYRPPYSKQSHVQPQKHPKKKHIPNPIAPVLDRDTVLDRLERDSLPEEELFEKLQDYYSQKRPWNDSISEDNSN